MLVAFLLLPDSILTLATGIGRKFAITEAICFLARLLRRWRVDMLTRPGETRAEWEKRVVRGVVVMNLGIGDVPVRLVRR